MCRKSLDFVLVWLLAASCGLCADRLSYPDLVRRLTDLDRLAVAAPVGETTVLASSYDRRSAYDAATDTYHYWDGNSDDAGIVRQEGDESVLMDVKGPGCIWRTWSARPMAGHVKMYLDGSATPSIDLPFNAYFDDSAAPFTRPHLVYKTSSQGWDNFTPIPFLKSCKIVADKGWGTYYHFNYTVFPAGTVVPTFAPPLSDADNAALDEADKKFENAGANPMGKRPGEKTDAANVCVAAGATATVADLPGAGAITALKVKFPMPSDPADEKNLLRQLAIRITWDGDKKPAVWSPLGDFFANALFPAKYSSLVTGLAADGQYYAYWYMPFASGAHVQVENDSANPILMKWEVSHTPLAAAKSASLLRFHAKWHRDAFPPKRADRAPDWTLLVTQGTGRYVGTQLHLWNPRGGWWGEGDDKFFVDGEKFPSTFGTGSEDYFGFAWGSGDPFHEPLHGQPSNEGNNGHASLYRWHLADNIPFQTGFEGVIEKYYPNSRPTLYDAVAFWYLAPGGQDPYPEVPVAGRIGYWNPPPPLVPRADIIKTVADTGEPDKSADIIEGESLQDILGDAITQGMGDYHGQWSGGSQLLWRPYRVESHAIEQLPKKKAGSYRLVLRLTQGPDFGIIQFSVNDIKVGPPIDMHGDTVTPAQPIDLGIVQLKDGTNTLDMDVVGVDAAATAYNAGIDYLKLTPVP